MKNILIIGATGTIAESLAREWAEQREQLYLTGRDEARLLSVAADLRVRGARVEHALLDATDFYRHGEVVDAAFAALGRIDIALIAHGSLPDQRRCEADAQEAVAAFELNAVSVISLLTHLASHMEVQGSGTLAVIGSVAGDRGRQSNYVYGAAKAAVDVFLQGLRNRLHPSGVRVLTIKPGLVDTRMTAAFRKGPLWASPQLVARGIVKAIERRADIAYVPGFWRLVMLAIRLVPESIFKRMKL
jgi:decaprenylphospho-beta-D-erythro-pentofuranosid-2-ulose 2-reductase